MRGVSFASGKPKGELKGSHYIYGMSEVNSYPFVANFLVTVQGYTLEM
ncbi:MAG: hypothetical protein AB1422_12495 [bacterium]